MTTENSPSGWCTVATYSDRTSAYIAKGMLESNGIPVTLTNATLSSVYPMTDTWASVSLLVPPSMAESARRLLKLDAPVI